MTKPKGSSEKTGKLSGKYASVWETVKGDLDSRSSRTLKLLDDLPINKKDLIDIFKLYKVYKKGKSIGEMTFRLQVALKMPAVNDPTGTDGLYGINTFRATMDDMETRFPKVYPKFKKKADVHAKSMTKRSVVARATVRTSSNLSSGEYTGTNAEKIKKGAIPFAIPRVGAKLDDQNFKWYRKQHVAHKNVNKLLKILESRVKYVDAIKRYNKLLGFKNKTKLFKKMVVNYHLSMGKVESDLNPYCISGLGWSDWKTKVISGKKVRIRRGPRVRKGPELGMYQFQDRYWQKRGRSEGMRVRYFVKQRGKGIDYSALKGMNFNERSVADLGPAKQAILFSLSAIGGSRHRRYTNVEEIFQKIHSTSGETQEAWIKMLRLKWLMGKAGAEKVIKLLKKDEANFPTTTAGAIKYYRANIKGTAVGKEISERIFKIAVASSKKFVRFWKQTDRQLNIDALGL
jgi:hypothetical protein